MVSSNYSEEELKEMFAIAKKKIVKETSVKLVEEILEQLEDYPDARSAIRPITRDIVGY